MKTLNDSQLSLLKQLDVLLSSSWSSKTQNDKRYHKWKFFENKNIKIICDNFACSWFETFRKINLFLNCRCVVKKSSKFSSLTCSRHELIKRRKFANFIKFYFTHFISCSILTRNHSKSIKISFQPLFILLAAFLFDQQ